MSPQCLGSRGRGIMSSRLSLVSMDYMRPCLKKKKKDKDKFLISLCSSLSLLPTALPADTH